MNVKKFVDEIRYGLSSSEEILTREEVLKYIEKNLFGYKEFKQLSIYEIKKIVKRVTYSIMSEVSILQPYMEDSTISEIMVNGYKDIFIERDGRVTKLEEEFFDIEELENVIRRIASKVHREINERNPIVDARMENGCRVNGVYKNIALGGPILTIRKFPESSIKMEDLIRWGTITADAAEFLQELVNRGYNFFISGGTSTGKTTFLNALSNYIKNTERVITIEDSAELKIEGLINLVRMESKNTNNFNGESIGMDQLIKTSLRMRPDRIIIGEIRDGKSLLNMLNGLNTGHSGMSTGHGNSARGMINRMEALYMQEVNFPIEAIDVQIVEGIDIIIHLTKTSEEEKKVVEISELYIDEDIGRIKRNELFIFKKNRLIRTDNKLIKQKR